VRRKLLIVMLALPLVALLGLALYAKLGGTLTSPSMSVEPLRATATTVAAWTTGGLSFLAKGFWDRATSGKKICRKARKKAGFD